MNPKILKSGLLGGIYLHRGQALLWTGKNSSQNTDFLLSLGYDQGRSDILFVNILIACID